MIGFLDAYYHEHYTSVACLVAAHWGDRAPATEFLRVLPGAQPYVAGQFFRRELPFLLSTLEEVRPSLSIIVIDGYVWLSSDRKPGLGGHLYSALERRIPVVGIAKTLYIGAPAVPVLRGRSRTPLFVTAAGMAADRAAAHVRVMHGSSRIPTLLQRVDRLSRSGQANVTESLFPFPRRAAHESNT